MEEKKNRYDFKADFDRLLNRKIKKQCKTEICNVIGWTGSSTFSNYLRSGFDAASPYVEKIKEIINKYFEKQQVYFKTVQELQKLEGMS